MSSLDTIRATIKKAQSSPLAKEDITLIGISKTQAPRAIEACIAQGVTHFGENMVQEAQSKWPTLRERHPNVRLHMVGRLQTNKVRQAIALFDTIHSLDNLHLAEVLRAEMTRARKELPCFIQINTGAEPQKSGVRPQEASAFIHHCIDVLVLPICGLMCVPPVEQPPAPHFALLRQIAQAHGLEHLSMGMSDDYETAIRMGATHVRIGRALFGERMR